MWSSTRISWCSAHSFKQFRNVCYLKIHSFYVFLCKVALVACTVAVCDHTRIVRWSSKTVRSQESGRIPGQRDMLLMPRSYALVERCETLAGNQLIVRNCPWCFCIVFGKLFFYHMMFGCELHYATEIKRDVQRLCCNVTNTAVVSLQSESNHWLVLNVGSNVAKSLRSVENYKFMQITNLFSSCLFNAPTLLFVVTHFVFSITFVPELVVSS